MIKTFQLLLFGFLITSRVVAQPIDLTTLAFRYGVPQSYKEYHTTQAEEIGLFFDMKYGFKLSEDSTWFVVGNLNYFNYQLQNISPLEQGYIDPIQLQGVIFRSGIKKHYNGGKSFQLLFAPRYMSTYEDFSTASIQPGAMALFEKQNSLRFKIGYGVLYNKELFGPLVTPLISIFWKPSPKWRISGLLPIYSKIAYLAGERLNIGICHFALTTSYALAGEYRDQYIERNSIDFAAFARYRLLGNLHVESRLGYAVGRKYSHFENDQKLGLRFIAFGIGDDRVQNNIDVKSGAIGELRLVYVISN